MRILLRQRIMTFICTAGLLLMPMLLWAQAPAVSAESPVSVLVPGVALLLFDATSRADQETADSIGTRLAGQKVRFERVPLVLSPNADKSAIARQRLIQGDSRMVFFWEHDDRRQIQFWYKSGPEGQTELKTIVRSLDGVGDFSQVEATALIAATTVELLLDTELLVVPPAPPAASPSLPPAMDAPSSSWARLYVRLGYRALLVSGRPDVSHGGALAVEYRIFKPMRLMIGMDLASPVTSRDERIALTRKSFPLQLGLAAIWRTDRWHVGFTGLMVMDVNKLEAATTRSDVALEGGEFEIQLLLGLNGYLAFMMTDILGIYADAGVWIAPEKRSYAVSGGPRLFDEYWRVWPRISVGLQLSLF